MMKLSDAKRSLEFASALMEQAKLPHDRIHASAHGFLVGLRAGRAEGKKTAASNALEKVGAAFASVFMCTKGWQGDEITKVWKRIKDLAEKMP